MARNDVTGDRLVTKPSSDKYRDNYAAIFGKPKDNPKKKKGRNES